MLSGPRRHKKLRTFATRTRIQPAPVEKRPRDRKFPSLLFGMVTVGLIATHSALNASTSGGVPTDYLGWLLRNELAQIPGKAETKEVAEKGRESKTLSQENLFSVRESIRLAALKSPAVRMDRGRPQVEEHHRVIIERISRGDTLSSLLQRQNISLRTIYAIARGARTVFNLSANFQTGKLVKLVFDDNKQLTSMAYPLEEGNVLVIRKTPTGDFKGALEKGDIGVASVPADSPPVSVTAPDVKVIDKQAADILSNNDRKVAPPAAVVVEKEEEPAENKAKSPKTATSASVTIKAGDHLTSLLAAYNIDETTTMEVVRASKQLFDIARMLQPGKVLNLDIGADGLLQTLSYPVDGENVFWLRREGDAFVPKVEKKSLVEKKVVAAEKPIEKKTPTSRLETISAAIKADGSLFAAGSHAGLTNAQSAALAELFEWDIDFARDIRAGDSFSVVRDTKYIQDKRVGEGRILAAEFINQGKVYRVVYYTNPRGESGYYDSKGQSIRKMFIRAPVDFRRISSVFSSNRKHPVFGFTRAHKGVDYAADMGTPVRAVGDGMITHAAYKGSFGRLILVRHNSTYTTAYAHLGRFSNEVRPGMRVRQGQTIGYVGMTGVTTGPHLHFEVRVNDQQVDPLTVQMASANPVASGYRTDFLAKTQPLLAMLKSGNAKVAALSPDSRQR
ncbi:MAG: peptidoglycan DD-metalloendopeptidase family protein [Magnetococcales bacterium]|nr:peptidoglycan DD-metalloendopeptidase family protein [Magnetococcales bacterium]